MLQAHLVFSLIQSWDQPILKGTLAPLTGEWYLEIKTWEPAVLIVNGLSLILDRPSPWTVIRNIVGL